MPVFVLVGEEDFELSRRLRALKDSLLDPLWSSVNFVRMDNPGIYQICDIAISLPFGPGNKVILVDRCDLFTKKKAKDDTKHDTRKSNESEIKTQLDRFEQAISNISQHTYLIFACPHNFDSTLRFSKAVERHATIEKFEKEKYFIGGRNPRLETWVKKEAKHFGTTIEDRAVTYLLASTEANLRQISSELNRISVEILPEKHITSYAAEASCPHYSHIFVLADRFISGNSREALASLAELLSRQSAIPIIAALQTMLSKWIHVKVICDEFSQATSGNNAVKRPKLPFSELVKTVSSRLKVMPIAAEKDLKRVLNIPIETLIEKRIQLTRFEALIKSGQLREPHAMNLFLVS